MKIEAGTPDEEVAVMQGQACGDGRMSMLPRIEVISNRRGATKKRVARSRNNLDGGPMGVMHGLDANLSVLIFAP